MAIGVLLSDRGRLVFAGAMQMMMGIKRWVILA